MIIQPYGQSGSPYAKKDNEKNKEHNNNATEINKFDNRKSINDTQNKPKI